jgi:hypothetical protein
MSVGLKGNGVVKEVLNDVLAGSGYKTPRVFERIAR